MADPAFTPEALGFAIMEVTNGSPNSHSGDFFQKQGALHIAKAIHALRAMGRQVSFTTIYPVLTDARSTVRFIEEMQYFPNEIPSDSAVKSKGPRPDPAIAPYFDHFQNTFIAMPPDQFGGVIGTILNALSPFQTPEVAEVFASENQQQSFNYSDLDKSKVLCISLPQIYPQERYALNVLFKHLFYQYAMTRYDLPAAELKKANVLALWLDEAQHSLRKGDWGDYRWLARVAESSSVETQMSAASASRAAHTQSRFRMRLSLSLPFSSLNAWASARVGSVARVRLLACSLEVFSPLGCAIPVCSALSRSGDPSVQTNTRTAAALRPPAAISGCTSAPIEAQRNRIGFFIRVLVWVGFFGP